MHSPISFGTEEKITFCVSMLLATRQIMMPNVINMQTMYYRNGICSCLCFILCKELAPSDLHSEKCMSWLQVQAERKILRWNETFLESKMLKTHETLLVTKNLLNISNPTSTFIVNYSCCCCCCVRLCAYNKFWPNWWWHNVFECMCVLLKGHHTATNERLARNLIWNGNAVSSDKAPTS